MSPKQKIFTVTAALISSVSSADIPSKIIFVSKEQPELAVFEFKDGPKKGSTEGYAIGCQEVRQRWGGIDTTTVSAKDYASIPVAAHIHCKQGTKVYGPSDSGTNVFILKHSDGQFRRHPIDHKAWVYAVGFNEGQKTDLKKLISDYPLEGVHFHSSVRDFCINIKYRSDYIVAQQQNYVEAHVTDGSCNSNGARRSVDKIILNWKYKNDGSWNEIKCEGKEICVFDKREVAKAGDKQIKCMAAEVIDSNIRHRKSSDPACGQSD